MKYELHFIDYLQYFIDEELREPWKVSTDLSELIPIAEELRSCANENRERIQGYWAQIWIEPEYGDIMTF